MCSRVLYCDVLWIKVVLQHCVWISQYRVARMCTTPQIQKNHYYNKRTTHNKRTTYYSALLRKITYKLRYPMGLRFSVLHTDLRFGCDTRIQQTLQQTATNCSTPHHSALRLQPLGVAQCVAVYFRCCSVLQCAAVCCSVLQCAAVCCSVLQCAAV